MAEAAPLIALGPAEKSVGATVEFLAKVYRVVAIDEKKGLATIELIREKP